MDSRPNPKELATGSECSSCRENRGEAPPEFYVKVRGDYVRIDGIRVVFCNHCGKPLVSVLSGEGGYESQGLLLPSETVPGPQKPAGAGSASGNPAHATPIGSTGQAAQPPSQSLSPSLSPSQPRQPVASAPLTTPTGSPPAQPQDAGKKKGGIFGRFFGKKDEPQAPQPQPAPTPVPVSPRPQPLPPPAGNVSPPPPSSIPPPPPPDEPSVPLAGPPSRGQDTDLQKSPLKPPRKTEDDDYLPPVLPF